jgi:hypothetical protein
MHIGNVVKNGEPFHLSLDDLRQHLSVLDQSGSGKSGLLTHHAL